MKTELQHLRPSEYRTMPWKNGGGSTTELRVEPPGGGLSAFGWRLSIAEVGQSGPFSAFAGVDRTITLLSGDGMALDFGPAGKARLDVPWRPLVFSGDLDTECRLLGGPCRDFNVMSRRARWHHQVTILRLDVPLELPKARIVAVFALAGAVRVGAVHLGLEETVILRDAGVVSALPEAPGAALLCAALWPLLEGGEPSEAPQGDSK